MPRKLMDPESGDPDRRFGKRSWILKHEGEQAMRDPAPLLENLRHYHQPSDKQPTLKFRFIGPVNLVLAELNGVLARYPLGKWRIMKVERDRKNRPGVYVSDALRVYVEVGK